MCHFFKSVASWISHLTSVNIDITLQVVVVMGVKLLSTPSVGGMTAQIVSNAQLPNLPCVIKAAWQHYVQQKPQKIYSFFKNRTI